jgi:guanosine-3',5'-bis(diphosphate) 3'-pyrophosphohydrolase
MDTKGNSDHRFREIISMERMLGQESLLLHAYEQSGNYPEKEKWTDRLDRKVSVAEILTNDLQMGPEPVISVFLKDHFENGLIENSEVEKVYGKRVLDLLTGLQKINRLDTNKFSSNSENFIKLLLTLSDDIRVILVRLGQQLQDLRDISSFPDEKQKLIVGETSVLYIPIAHRIGLYRIKKELEDRVMQFCNPEMYSMIEKKIIETQKDREKYSAGFIRPIEKRLKEGGFDCEILSRVKSVPSIWRKMQVQKVDFEKVYDLFAIRIIINNTIENEKADCWRAYSVVTDIYTPNPRRLRDWITYPKTTGYESLHTTVIGLEGRWVEVQIRTRRMDDIAEKSIAAHWKYKSDGKKGNKTEFYAAIREMLENPTAQKQEPVISKDKRSLYTDEIFIFTPKGDLKKLKEGYTVLDFAFEIHTGIGATCTGAIVNGTMQPLKHVLKNGDTVKILTSKNQKPNRDWLEFVQSPRVQARIRHALKMETYKESEWGKEIIKNKVTQLGFEFNDITVNKMVDYFGCESILDLYQKFGEGKLDSLKIKKSLQEPEIQPAAPPKEETLPEQISGMHTGKQDYITIDKNLNSVHYQFARCCNPIPGDNIFAFVSVTQGIKIHKTNCSNAHEMVTRYPYRILEARWKELQEDAKSFTANLSISGIFSDGVINRLSSFLTNDLKVSIRSSKVHTHSDNSYTWEIGIHVNGKIHLDDIRSRLLKLKEITNVKRITQSLHL